MSVSGRILRGVVVFLSTIVGLVALALLVLCGYGIFSHHVSGLVIPLLLCAMVLVLAYAGVEWALRPWIARGIERSAFYRIVASTIITSLLVCGVSYLISMHRLREKQEIIRTRTEELRPLDPLDRAVDAYLAERDRLQRTIDLINSLKQNQNSLSHGVQTVAELGGDAALIDGISISGVFDKTKKTSVAIVFYSHAPEAVVDALARKLGAQKHVQPNGSFTLAVAR